MTASLHLVPLLLAAVAVFDAGLLSAQVANQSAFGGTLIDLAAGPGSGSRRRLPSPTP